MPDASRTTVRIVEEVTPGTTPATPAFETMRPTAINLTFNPKTKISSELVADRQVTDLIRVGIEAGGDVPGELTYGPQHDTPMRGAFMSDWTYMPVRDNNGTADSNITAVDGAGVYTVLAGVAPLGPGLGRTVNTGTFLANMLVLATGFTAAANNGLKVLSAASGTSLTTAASTVEAVPPAAARLKAVGIQGASGDITATAGGTNFITTTALNFVNLGFVAGMWIKVGGTSSPFAFAGTNALNNDWVRISVVSATQLTLDVVPVGWNSDTGTGKTIQLFFGDYMRNGTTPRSYTLEEDYTDLSVEEWDYYTGARVGTMDIQATAQDIMTIKYTFMAFNGANQTSRFTGATTKAASTNTPMSSGVSVGQFRINGTLVGVGPNYVKEFTLTLDNTLRRQPGIGTLGDIGIGLGRAQVKGKISTYYGSNAVRTALLAGSAMSWNGVMYDPTVSIAGAYTQAYHLDVPYLKWADGSPTVPGVDTDRMLDLNYQGLKHPTYGYTLQVMRFDYIPT